MEQQIDNIPRKTNKFLSRYLLKEMLFLELINYFNKQPVQAMDFNRAKAYFQEGVDNGSPASHYVNFDLSFEMVNRRFL